MTRQLLLLVLCLATSACSNTTEPPTPVQTTLSWAPLAVHRSDAAMDGIEQGTLVVTDECVFLDDIAGQRVLVVFRLAPDLWSWDPATRQILAFDRSETLRFGDGDEIRLGGGGRSGAYGPSIEATLREQRWISPPDPECITPRVFFASGEIGEPE